MSVGILDQVTDDLYQSGGEHGVERIAMRRAIPALDEVHRRQGATPAFSLVPRLAQVPHDMTEAADRRRTQAVDLPAHP
jgi:hypothetical protein